MSEKPDKPAHAAAIRRDARNIKAPDSEVTKAACKKSRHWCKGKVGKVHTPCCMTYAEAKPGSILGTMCKDWRILVCSTCGKELEHYFPRTWDKRTASFDAKIPHWVTK